LLEVTPVSVSRWLNGHREPDGDSWWRISMYFLIDPWFLTDAKAKDLLPELVRSERFEAVERQIAEGVTSSQIDLEAQNELRHREEQRRQAAQQSEDPVLLLARAFTALAEMRTSEGERPVIDLMEALKESADETEERRRKELAQEAAHRERVEALDASRRPVADS
jgi:hypothetical protein